MIQKSFTLLLMLLFWKNDFLFFFWLTAIGLCAQLFWMCPKRKVRESNFNVCVIGAGFSGLAMGKRLKEMGVNFTIIEKESSLGGVWRNNRYPGCCPDLPVYMYSYSYYPHPYASKSYCDRNEIMKYLESFADEYRLRSSIAFDRCVEKCTWDERSKVWRISLSDGSVISANVVIPSCAVLQQPHVPELKNRNLFAGKAMHTATWDEDWDPVGKTVAVIGTGASAVQVVPELAKSADRLYVFQRTPSWYARKRLFHHPKLLQHLFRHLPFTFYLIRLVYFALHEAFYFGGLRNDGILVDIFRRLHTKEIPDAVRSPVLQRALTPDFPVGCKPILVSNEYLKAFNRENVTLITNPIEEFSVDSIKTRDGDYRIDCVVYATGFEVIRTLNSHYRRFDLDEGPGEEPCHYLGITHPSAPNYFALVGPNSVTSHSSVIWMIECQVDYVESCLRSLIGRELKSMVVKKEVFNNYRKWLRHWMSNKVFQIGSCTNWFRNKDGINFAIWPSHILHYWWLTKNVNLSDYNVG